MNLTQSSICIPVMGTKRISLYLFTIILLNVVNPLCGNGQTFSEFLNAFEKDAFHTYLDLRSYEDRSFIMLYTSPTFSDWENLKTYEENRIGIGFPTKYKIYMYKGKKFKTKKMVGNIHFIPKYGGMDCVDFSNLKNLTAIKINSTTHLSSTFRNCEKLEYADLAILHDRLEYIYYRDFPLISHVYRSELPDSIFLNCERLKCVLLPVQINSIGKDAFNGCKNLKMDLPAQINRIKQNAFRFCVSMPKTLYFGETVSLEDSVFAHTNIKHLIFKENAYISKNSLADMDSLETIYITKGGELNLTDMKNIKRLIIHADTMNAENCCFPNLEDIYFSGEIIKGFDNCPNLKNIIIEGNIINGFNNCPKLSDIQLKGRAFKYDYLKKDCIINGFENCTNLRNVNFAGNIKSISGFTTVRRNLAIAKVDHHSGYFSC